MVGNELSCAGCSVRTVLQAWSECEKMERRKNKCCSICYIGTSNEVYWKNVFQQ